MKQLETFGHQGHLGGWITSFLLGKVIDSCLKDGQWLILRTTCGHEAKIGWQDASGNQIKGEPFVENMDVRIFVQGASLSGIAGDA